MSRAADIVITGEQNEAGTGRDAAVPTPRTRRWLWPAVVAVLFCAPLFVNLGRHADLGNDEAIYSFSVDVVLKDNDWLTPKAIPFEDQPFLEKPPLWFWVVAGPIKLGLLPHDEFGLRFWDALFGAIGFLYVFAIGKRMDGAFCGTVAVLVLFSHGPLVFTHGLRDNGMDAPLFLAYGAAMYHFMAWRVSASEARRRWHVAAIALSFVLGFMTKFVAALFLPLVLGLALLTRGGRRRFAGDRRAWLASAVGVLLLCAPWFLYEYHRFGAQLWRVMFGTHVYQRFTTYVDPVHLQPWHYYFSTLLGELRQSGALAVTGLGLAAIAWRTVRRGWADGALVLAWFIVPLAIISLGSSKVYHYAYPFLPPLALSAGYGAAEAFRVLGALARRHLSRTDRASRALATRTIPAGYARRALLAVAVVSIGVLVATWANGGPLSIHFGRLVLLRNASLIRPAVLGLFALMLAGRLVPAVRLAWPLLLLFLLLPLGGYRMNLSRLAEDVHPLRTMRDCVQPIAARHAPPEDPRGLGVYVEDDAPSWPFYYYLRDLGRWFSRREGTSDTTIHTALFAPSLMRPILLGRRRYERFARLVQDDGTLAERGARKAGMTPQEMLAAMRQVPVAVVTFPADVVLLPGPYAACAPFDSTTLLR